MRIIAHRGNLNGPNEEHDNNPEHLVNVLNNTNFDLEIDVWVIDDKIFLGHDYGKYEIKLEFLLSNCNRLWCHAKNLGALSLMLKHNDINCFFHDVDKFVITSHRYIWTYPGNVLTENSICVMPEWNNYGCDGCYGVCTDYPYKYKNNSV